MLACRCVSNRCPLQRRPLGDNQTCSPHPRWVAVSLRLDRCELDHLGPFFRVFGYELLEIGRRAGKRSRAHIGVPSLDAGACQPRIDLAIEPLDDLGWRAPWRADA